MKSTAILVSPAPVDGYPPVQSQARLLADAGFAVELLTQPLPRAAGVRFQYPGVAVTALPAAQAKSSRLARLTSTLLQIGRYIVALTAIRRRSASIAIEIAYDPNGILMSDWALARPRRRIAHLHETLQRTDDFIEGRLKRSFDSYARVVVADEGRAKLLAEQMGLTRPPVTIPNFPLHEADQAGAAPKAARFEVIYGGSLGEDQMIPLIARSVALWPKDAVLVLIGDDTKPHVRALKAQIKDLDIEDRVIFEGWLDLDKLIGRYRRAHLGISLLSTKYLQWVMSVGASNKRYQYMQAGLPQIGDRMPGVPELLEGNQIGRCIVDYDEQSIADLVACYINDPAECAAAGRRAQTLHQERYNYQLAFEPTLRWIREGATN